MASTYLSRTLSSMGNRKITTISTWFKKSANGIEQRIASQGDASGNPASFIRFKTDDTLEVVSYESAYYIQLIPSQLFRDVNGWYHIVVELDTTQATASDRAKLYINGTQVTSFSTATYPSQNTDLHWNDSGYTIWIGKNTGSGEYYNGCMSHFHMIDGTAYDASTFGSFDSNGVWKPKTSPSVTYGTNGFFLKFENSGSMGTDSSGNGNNFTVNGSLTQTLDTPSNVYATLNPLLDVNAVGTYLNGNTAITGTGSTNFAGATIPVSSGKWYAEVKTATVNGSYPILGVIDAQSTLRRNSVYFVAADVDTNNPSGFAVFSNGDIYHNNSNTYGNLGTTYTSGDIIGLALDMDSGTKTLAFYKNGTLQTTINLDEPPSGYYMFATSIYATTSSAKAEWNFGNGYFGTTAVSSAGSNGNGSIFEYDVPTGYYALNTKNLATYG